ncbi:hypothetical protein T09_9943 [Trichinella sp. T9]|nr:hypothetical protein T09_9943 [Trichinella sp. T9]
MADGYSALPADEVELLKRGAINKHGKPVDFDDQAGLKNSEAGEEVVEINLTKPVAPKRKSRIHMKLEPEIFEIDLGEDGPATTTSTTGNDQPLSSSAVPRSDRKIFNDEIRSVEKKSADSIDCKSMNLDNASAAAAAAAHTLRDNATT